MAAVSVPVVHDEVPLTVYPKLQIGWHADPDARVAVQSPTPPLAGALLASHGLACAYVTVCATIRDQVNTCQSRHEHGPTTAAVQLQNMHVGHLGPKKAINNSFP